VTSFFAGCAVGVSLTLGLLLAAAALVLTQPPEDE